MTTEKQIAANRANAKHSTGPRTEAGKAVSRLNATTHGLTAKTIVLPGEDPAAFEDFQRGIFATMKPEDELQADLVAQMAANRWLSRRIPQFAAALSAWRTYHHVYVTHASAACADSVRAAEARLQKEFPDRSAEELAILRRHGEILATGGLNDLTRVLAYGDTLNRQFDRMLKQFKELQAMRAATIEHEPIEAESISCDAEDGTEDAPVVEPEVETEPV